MISMNRVEQNKRKNYVFIFLQNIDLTRGIWMIYLASKGMNLVQLGFLETIFHITSFTMEVPTGAIADIYGRRASRILGRLLSLVSVVILLVADQFGWFALSFVITALSYNMESGAGEALIYDSMKVMGEEKDYMCVAGNNEMTYQMANIISLLVGGYLATISYTLAFTITICIGILTFFYSFIFVEPKQGCSNTNRNKKQIFLKQLVESIDILKGYKKLGFLIVFSQLLGSLCTTIFYFLQNYMKGDGYSETFIGIIYALSALGAAILAPQVSKIERTIKERGILLFIPMVVTVCIWGIALFPFYYLFFIPLTMADGLIFVAISDYINKIIPSDYRATILSMASMIFSLFMIILFPVIGIIGDILSLKSAFLFIGIISTVLVIANAFILKHKSNN